MLKKGVNKFQFYRPFSAMRLALEAVENGAYTRLMITEATGLTHGKVDSAIKNLVYIGAIVRIAGKHGCSEYGLPGRVAPSSPIWAGKRSVFDVATNVENQMSSIPGRTDK